LMKLRCLTQEPLGGKRFAICLLHVRLVHKIRPSLAHVLAAIAASLSPRGRGT
jgi:hypothetical protein